MNFFNYILLVGSAASFVAGKRNVIQYEMEKLENNEDLKIETWWKEKVLKIFGRGLIIDRY